MNNAWQNIPIANGKTYTTASVDELKELAQKYPYSLLHQFLYAKKIKSTDQALYKKQATKAALLSSNLHWLDYILNTNEAEKNTLTTAPVTTDIETTLTDTTAAITKPVISQQEIIDIPEPPEEETALSAETEIGIFTGHEKDDTNTESSSLVSDILDREKEIAAQENELTFEPLYTVDYFASQGIKTTAETAPADKLGKQLRSFTEWLKMMKRLPAEETAPINESEEKKIQAAAEDSNAANEIVTETMADVLMKQGKPQKAIEIYQKLSLQHPEKSPYFAALIEQLKA